MDTLASVNHPHCVRLFDELDSGSSLQGHLGMKDCSHIFCICRIVGRILGFLVDVNIDGTIYTLGKKSAYYFLQRNQALPEGCTSSGLTATQLEAGIAHIRLAKASRAEDAGACGKQDEAMQEESLMPETLALFTSELAKELAHYEVMPISLMQFFLLYKKCFEEKMHFTETVMTRLLDALKQRYNAATPDEGRRFESYLQNHWLVSKTDSADEKFYADVTETLGISEGVSTTP